jgi:simple sugar transport system permease protein
MAGNENWNAAYNTLIKLIPSLVSVLVGLLAGLVILLCSNPFQALNGFRVILTGGLAGGPRGIGNVFYYAVPIMLTGLGVAFAFKTGLFNIGGSGQFVIAGFIAIFVSIKFPLPGILAWIIPAFLAMLGGAFWAVLAAAMNAFFKVNVVISTIMLNYIGMLTANQMVRLFVFDVTKNQSMPVPAASRIPKMGLDHLFPGSNINIGFILALLIVICVHILINKTILGFELKTCGLNRDASKYAGISEKRNIMVSMAISGALVGLGAAFMYLSDSGRNIKLVDVLAPEGFNGIPVALLAQNNPIGVAFSAIFIAYITVAGFYMQSYRFAPEVIDIIISVIIYFSAFSLVIYELLKKYRLGRKIMPAKKTAWNETDKSKGRGREQEE